MRFGNKRRRMHEMRRLFAINPNFVFTQFSEALKTRTWQYHQYDYSSAETLMKLP